MPFWLSIPVTVALALGVTQLLAVGMTSPLREMTAAARRMARGDYSGRVTATSSDEVGELARAFNRMAEDLAAVDRQRRELVANVSHELRTPLAALCAVLENLVDGVAEPDPAALRTALDQAERLATLVADLLDLARVDAGEAPLSAGRRCRSPSCSSAPSPRRGSPAEKVRYDVARRRRPRSRSRADPARLHQLVANLLDNASRHSPPVASSGSPRRTTATGWRLEVADEGPGIAAADRERVFERFGTLAETEGGGGTGLGLAIARWVTDLHGGSIHFVDPAPGSTGARVRVDLPHEPRRAHSVARQHPGASHARPGSTVPPCPPPQRPGCPEPVMDTCSAGSGPTTGVPGNVRAVLCSLGVGLLAGVDPAVPRPRARHVRWCCWRPGA